MKQVVNAGIGGRSFVMDNDAYLKLEKYLEQFKARIAMEGVQKGDVMDNLEERIAELFAERQGAFKDVVDIQMVNSVIAQLGMPDGQPFVDEDQSGKNGNGSNSDEGQRNVRKLYRDPDNKFIGGVASGLALYLDVDVVLLRVIFVVGCLMGLFSFWVYIIILIIAPVAVTPAQKCQMHGLPVTAENMGKFSN